MPSITVSLGIAALLLMMLIGAGFLVLFFMRLAREEVERMRKNKDKQPEIETMKTNFKNDDEGSAGVVVAIAAAVILVAGGLFWMTGMNNVDAGERTVVFHSNGELTVLQPGMYQFQNPITTDTFTYNVQSQLHTDTAQGITKDLQVVNVEVAVLYHPDVSQIGWIHQTLGPDYASRVIPPSVQDAVKGAASYSNAEDLTAGTRELVKQDITTRITEDLARNHLIVDQVSVTDFDFSAQFNAAIEAKAIAQQKAQEAKNKLEQTRFEANATVVQAMAQAESARIISEQIEQNPQYVEYLYAQAFANNWNGQMPMIQGSGATPIVNMGSGSPFRSG